MRSIKKGATSQTVYFEFLDSASTTGGRKTGLAFNTSGIVAYYARNGAAAVAITLVTQTAAGAWSSGGFAEVDATNMPGLYRLDVPNAAFAGGAESVVITMRGAAGMAQASLEIALVDNTAADIMARIGAPAGASVSADIATVVGYVDTEIGTLQTTATAIKAKTDSLSFTVAGQVDANVTNWKGATAPAMTGDAFARLGAPAGASVSADVAAVKGVLPAALVSGRIDCSVGAMAAGVLTATAIAADAITDAKVASDVTIAQVTGSVGSVAGNVGGSIGSLSAQAKTDVENSVWNTVISGHLTAGTTGNALNAAGSAGDPWSTPLPGAYGAGTAGNIMGNRLDAAISTRLAAAGYTAPDNATIAAIKAKTDNLPASPAAVSDIPTANANADALLDRANGVETGWTLRQALRIVLSALGGKLSGAATSTVTIRNVGDSKDRVVATVDADGNRTAVTLDAT